MPRDVIGSMVAKSMHSDGSLRAASTPPPA